MRKLLWLLFILLATSACLITPQPSSNPPAPTSQNGGISGAPTIQAGSATDSAPASTGEPAKEPAGDGTFTEYASGALWVHLFSPRDGDTVNTPTVKVRGQAPAETVITINDEIIAVSPDQSFEAEIHLEVGPNLIEIVASDLNDNEIYIPLTVDYEP